jgi:hypothetical protein
MVVQRPGETEIAAEGAGLKAFWNGYTTAPGETAVGTYLGRLIRDNASDDDGYAELECSALKFSNDAYFNFNTSLRQVTSPIRIFSVRRGLNPYLMFSARVAADFNNADSIGTVKVMNASNESYCYKLWLTTSDVLQFSYLGTEIALPATLVAALLIERTANRLLTKPFDFYIVGQRKTANVVGLRTNYSIKFYIVVDGQVFNIHSVVADVRFNDYFQAEFTCEAII